MYSIPKLRTIIIILSIVVSAALFFFMSDSYTVGSRAAVDLGETFAFIAVWVLFFTLLPGPFYRLFPNAPLKSIYLNSRSGLGISVFYFALLHGITSFFVGLGGFKNLPFIDSTNSFSILLGFLALCILAALAVTSFAWAFKWLGKKWKTLHQSVYIAGVLIVVHVVVGGSHFRSFDSFHAVVFPIAVILLLLMHMILVRRRTLERHPEYSPRTVSIVSFIIFALVIVGLYILQTSIHTHA